MFSEVDAFVEPAPFAAWIIVIAARKRRLSMVNVTNRSNVYMRLRTLEFRLRPSYPFLRVRLFETPSGALYALSLLNYPRTHTLRVSWKAHDRDFEPDDLVLTKDALYQLSYAEHMSFE